MSNDTDWMFIRTVLAARLERVRKTSGDRGAFSIELMMVVAGLVAVAAIAAAVILNKVNEKKNEIQ
ncbi:hypothetical protein ACFVUW_10375 [Streptomyces xiamenensis]|uniref:hypothetical protein n=1 Tax=Streptomyces xiamenensis TaxID=408015 RepID=UPI0036E26E85